jgi:signal transduction histidine kinase
MQVSRQSDLTLDGLVHDLNNVFQTIIDAAELVGSDPNWNSVSAIVLRSVEQGRRIVSSIVDTDHRTIDFERLLEKSIAFTQDVAAAMKRPKVHFIRDIAPGLRFALNGASLERVLVNLFINSAQAAAEAGHGGCKITISARESGGEIRIRIADDGPGIAPQILPAIFAPRFSTQSSRSGLGLHIVRTLVTAAGGTVSAANGEGGGAVFSISFPTMACSAEPLMRTAAAR